MAKSPKFNRDHIEKLKQKGLIGEDTYRICMADGGVVPAVVPDIQNMIQNATSIADSEKAFSAQKENEAKLAQIQAEREQIQNSMAVDAKGGVPAEGLQNKFGGRLSQLDENEKQLKSTGSGIEQVSMRPAVASGSDAQSSVVPVSDLVLKNPQATNPLTQKMQGLGQAFQGQMDAFGQAQGAALDIGKAQAAEAKETSSILGNTQKRQAQMEAERIQHEQQRQEMSARAETDFNTQLDDFNKMKVDPQNFQKKFWADAGTGQKLLAGIGLILGGFGNNGSGNAAVKVLENAIDRDINAQKANIEKAGQGLSQKRGMLQQMRERFGDERMSEIAAKRAALEEADLQIKQTAAKYKSPEALANARMASAQIQIKKEELRMSFAERAAQVAMFSQAGVSGNDNTVQRIMMGLPKEMHAPALKEYGDFQQIQSSINRVDKVIGDVAKLTTAGARLSSPVQSKSLLAKAEADLFPIVKTIVGERMTDSDARTLIAPYLPKMGDSAQTVSLKTKGLKDALNAQLPGRTPILSGLGMIPKPTTIDFGKPVR